MMRTTKNYIDNQEFLAEMAKWRNSAEHIEDRQPTEKLGKLLLDLHEHILCHRNFVGYRQDLKDEMKSYSLYRIFKRGLFTYDFSCTNPFGYFTRSIFLNYYTVLSRYYKKLNQHQEYMKGLLARIDTQGNPKLEAYLQQFQTSR